MSGVGSTVSDVSTLVKGLRSKYSQPFIANNNSNQNTSDMRIPLSSIVRLDPMYEYEIAMVSFNSFNSIYNISAALKNNMFYYSNNNGTSWKTLFLQVGGILPH